jgi:sulfate adenylyltransferase (ADP) / ATP adenylyltransferase
LLQKPNLPAPQFETGAANHDHERDKRADVFKPPYNPNLYVGELQDEGEGTEYVVLVSHVVVITPPSYIIIKND